MPQVAVLLTCYNRVDKTLSCLSALYSVDIPNDYRFVIYLVDDGSIDSTADTVKTLFPSVKIIYGNGHLFWNRGMHLAWETASLQRDYDYYLWLNDDTILFDDSLSVLLNCSESYSNERIIVGSTCSAFVKGQLTYGGWTKKNGLLAPSAKPIECDLFNGNIVLVPRFVYKKVGLIDPIFRHALGDFDYGLRAGKLGIQSIIAPNYLGTCELHDDLPAWCNPKTSLRKRFVQLYKPLGSHPIEFFKFDYRHNGLIAACLHFVTIHFRALTPSLWATLKNK